MPHSFDSRQSCFPYDQLGEMPNVLNILIIFDIDVKLSKNLGHLEPATTATPRSTSHPLVPGLSGFGDPKAAGDF
jgi:hypothetical protein